jgi:hypothetical protein
MSRIEPLALSPRDAAAFLLISERSMSRLILRAAHYGGLEGLLRRPATKNGTCADQIDRRANVMSRPRQPPAKSAL